MVMTTCCSDIAPRYAGTSGGPGASHMGSMGQAGPDIGRRDLQPARFLDKRRPQVAAPSAGGLRPESCDPGYMRRRHARPLDGVVPPRHRPTREHSHARTRQVNLAAVNGLTARRERGDVQLRVHRPDGHDRRAVRRDPDEARLAEDTVGIVARGRDDERAAVQRTPTDGLVRWVDLADIGTQGHRHDVALLIQRPFNAGDDAGVLAETLVVKHLADEHLRLWGDSVTATGGRGRGPGGRAGAMRAVAVPVLRPLEGPGWIG